MSRPQEGPGELLKPPNGLEALLFSLKRGGRRYRMLQGWVQRAFQDYNFYIVIVHTYIYATASHTPPPPPGMVMVCTPPPPCGPVVAVGGCD